MITKTQTSEILEYVLPFLLAASRYSRQIQRHISAQPSKASENIFAAALSDADLSIQGFIEVALLGKYPSLRFHGEEYETSLNTKYFTSTEFGADDELLALLDPIDGTRLYLDQRDDYMILFGLMTTHGYEGGLAVLPGKGEYLYGIKGRGTYRGSFNTPFKECTSVHLASARKRVLLWESTGSLRERLALEFEVVDYIRDYRPDISVSSRDLLYGEFCGLVSEETNFIDGAMLCFLAKEAGAVVSDYAGNPLPAPGQVVGRSFRNVLMSVNTDTQQKLIRCLDGVHPILTPS